MAEACKLCGEPMPEGEGIFNYHGYSGPCPKPPLPKVAKAPLCERIERRIRELPAKSQGGLASSNLGRLLSDEIIKRIAHEAADEAQS